MKLNKKVIIIPMCAEEMELADSLNKSKRMCNVHACASLLNCQTSKPDAKRAIRLMIQRRSKLRVFSLNCFPLDGATKIKS